MRSDVVLACAWALFSSTHGVPLHFSFPLEDEVLFGNNLRIVWRYDVRCASNSQSPPMAKRSRSCLASRIPFDDRNASAVTILLNGDVIASGPVWGEGLVHSASRRNALRSLTEQWSAFELGRDGRWIGCVGRADRRAAHVDGRLAALCWATVRGGDHSLHGPR